MFGALRCALCSLHRSGELRCRARDGVLHCQHPENAGVIQVAKAESAALELDGGLTSQVPRRNQVWRRSVAARELVNARVLC